MLDLTGIVFSSVMILLVILRALQLNNSEPWFQTLKQREGIKKKVEATWKARN